MENGVPASTSRRPVDDHPPSSINNHGGKKELAGPYTCKQGAVRGWVSAWLHTGRLWAREPRGGPHEAGPLLRSLPAPTSTPANWQME